MYRKILGERSSLTYKGMRMYVHAGEAKSNNQTDQPNILNNLNWIAIRLVDQLRVTTQDLTSFHYHIFKSYNLDFHIIIPLLLKINPFL